MRIGMDANGRSFRWAAESVQSAYSVSGVLPDIQGDRIIWNNSGASDPTKPIKNTMLEEVWRQFNYIGAVSGPSTSQEVPGREIADAIAQRVPQSLLDCGLVLAVPNMLDETGQSALLSALEQSRLYNALLLWRPVAIAMSWAGAKGERAQDVASRDGSLVVWDFESPHLEVTTLRWKEKDGYLCPVRHYPIIPECQRPYSSYDHAARLVSKSIPPESVLSLLSGPYGEKLQSNWELNEQKPVLYQDHTDPRRWKNVLPITDVSDTELMGLERELTKEAREHRENHYVIHGWSAAHLHVEERNVEFVPLDSVVLGCREYAESIELKRPTYFDTLPEYRIWAKYINAIGTYDYDFLTVVEKTEVEGNKEWSAARDGHDKTKETLNNFSIAQHKNLLSLFVQNRNQFADEKEHLKPPSDKIRNGITIAKNLVMNLPTTTRGDVPLKMDVMATPAAGHIRITIQERNLADGNKSIFGDTGEAEFSWKTAKPEPEYKGFLEAQEVVGRIMDQTRPGGVAQTYGIHDYKEMARLLVKKLHGQIAAGSPEMTQLQTAINDYRPGAIIVAAVSDEILIKWVLEPWGYTHNPATSQPTRGLFGSRMEDDADVRAIAAEISNIIIGHTAINNANKWKYLNYMFVYAPERFKQRLRAITSGPPANTTIWIQVIAPGRVFSTADDFRLFIETTLGRRFILPDTTYAQHYLWSFFRCLCYHECTAAIPSDLVYRFLVQLIEYNHIHPLTPAGHNDQRRKYALHAILFALRKRDPELPPEFRDKDFLNPDSDLGRQLNHLITDGTLHGEGFPPSMIAGMTGMIAPGDNFSRYVWRFLNYKDTLKDRQIGSGLATS